MDSCSEYQVVIIQPQKQVGSQISIGGTGQLQKAGGANPSSDPPWLPVGMKRSWGILKTLHQCLVPWMSAMSPPFLSWHRTHLGEDRM